MPSTQNLIPLIDATSGGSQIVGDRAIALTAQVNRYAKANGYPEQPLTPGVVTIATGLAALGFLQARLTDALFKATPQDRIAINTQMSAISHAQSDPVAYLTPRIVEATQTLAIWGDIQGFPPATVGITTRDPRVKRWYQQWWGIGLISTGALALVGVATRYAMTSRRLPR